eukprot:GHRR01004876.1.p1 GENE.GHRR01004876.1~~GHRR01004876.1.p1  ORF type:complete len:509 (+),score=197.41 GHRR01004876.1:1145-2671(+)
MLCNLLVEAPAQRQQCTLLLQQQVQQHWQLTHPAHKGLLGSLTAHRSSKQQTRQLVVLPATASEPAVPAPGPYSRVLAAANWLPDRRAVQLVTDAWVLLYSNLWAVIIIFLAKDAAAFLLHRVAHRITNQIAERALGIPISSMGNPWWIMANPQSMEGRVGYQVLVGIFFLMCLPLNILFNTVAVSTAAAICTARKDQPGQSMVQIATFIGQGSGKVGLAECSPGGSPIASRDDTSISVIIDNGGSTKPAAPAATAVVAAGMVSFHANARPGRCSFRQSAASSSNTSSCSSSEGIKAKQKAEGPRSSSSSSSRSTAWPAADPAPWLAIGKYRSRLPHSPGFKASVTLIQKAWHEHVANRVKQLWTVDLLFNMWSLPLQAACLAVLPAFWAFPHLLDIQLALPAAVLGNAKGKNALDQSRRLMAGFKQSYAWPFVWLIVLGRLLELVREIVLVSLPVRLWTDVIEVPLLATALFAVARVVLLRVQNLVPLAAYLQRTAGGAASGAQKDR